MLSCHHFHYFISFFAFISSCRHYAIFAIDTFLRHLYSFQIFAAFITTLFHADFRGWRHCSSFSELIAFRPLPQIFSSRPQRLLHAAEPEIISWDIIYIEEPLSIFQPFLHWFLLSFHIAISLYFFISDFISLNTIMASRQPISLRRSEFQPPLPAAFAATLRHIGFAIRWHWYQSHWYWYFRLLITEDISRHYVIIITDISPYWLRATSWWIARRA